MEDDVVDQLGLTDFVDEQFKDFIDFVGGNEFAAAANEFFGEGRASGLFLIAGSGYLVLSGFIPVAGGEAFDIVDLSQRTFADADVVHALFSDLRGQLYGRLGEVFECGPIGQGMRLVLHDAQHRSSHFSLYFVLEADGFCEIHEVEDVFVVERPLVEMPDGLLDVFVKPGS